MNNLMKIIIGLSVSDKVFICSSLHLINVNVCKCMFILAFLIESRRCLMSKFVFDNCKKSLVSSDSRISEYLHKTEFKLVFLTWSKFDTHQIMCFLQLQQNFLTFIFFLLLEDWPCSLELCSAKPSLSPESDNKLALCRYPASPWPFISYLPSSFSSSPTCSIHLFSVLCS